MDENNIKEIARGHGWPENEFLSDVKRLVKSYGYTEEGALAESQRVFTRKFGTKPKPEKKIDPQTESRLRRIAKTQGYDEDAFLLEYGRLILEGLPGMEALSQVMELFEKGAYKAEKKPTLADFTSEKLEEPSPTARLGAPPGQKPVPPKVEAKPKATKPDVKATAYDKLMDLTESHLAEIYGQYGTGKSRLAHHVAVEAQNAGKRVLFIDTEGGLLDEHVKQLKNYWYVGDSIEALEDAVAKAEKQRGNYDLLVVDSVGHPVYVNYVELLKMQQKLRAYQRLAMVFRDMVRFARGERGVDMGKRRGLAVCVNHTVSEFSRIAKELPPEEPLDPFGGQIHRVPKVILRSELAEASPNRSVFRLLSFKLRGMPKNVEVGRFTIDSGGTKVEWKV